MEIKDFRPNFDIENLFQGDVAGVDEVGYGAWSGPVVAAAVILSKNCPKSLLNLLNDSKKLSASKRSKIYDLLCATPGISIGIGQSSVEEIDQLNIRHATLLAMSRSIENLPTPPSVIIIDGKVKPACLYPCHTYIKGDEKSYSIAAASIIAKVTRDRLMIDLSILYPYFGWEKNVGYGTKFHSNALIKYGPTLWHRKSYKPIAALHSTQGEQPFSSK